MDPRLSSAISALVAALVPVLDSAFHWHMQTTPLVTLVMALLGLAALELGHKWVDKLPKGTGDAIAAIAQSAASAIVTMRKGDPNPPAPPAQKDTAP